MENKELHALLLSQLANYLWDYGTYLNQRHNETYKIKLYFWDDKYFEIYETIEKETILKIIKINLEEVISFYNPGSSPDEKQLVRQK